ncbi:hypothetical protein FACS1894124_2090 [Spirochaetia bacterium]|nr:hypothetical protein FACS1894124_2090 [Spirochaetia bacterium]
MGIEGSQARARCISDRRPDVARNQGREESSKRRPPGAGAGAGPDNGRARPEKYGKVLNFSGFS